MIIFRYILLKAHTKLGLIPRTNERSIAPSLKRRTDFVRRHIVSLLLHETNVNCTHLKGQISQNMIRPVRGKWVVVSQLNYSNYPHNAPCSFLRYVSFERNMSPSILRSSRCVTTKTKSGNYLGYRSLLQTTRCNMIIKNELDTGEHFIPKSRINQSNQTNYCCCLLKNEHISKSNRTSSSL